VQRDSHGRIFVVANPTCFRAIVDYMNEMMISSKEGPPSPPTVDDEQALILQHQERLFGAGIMIEFPNSNIIKDERHSFVLHDLLEETGS
jgi:hypothetical protein